MKKCGRCGLVKPLDDFHRRGENGRQLLCKPCRNLYDREYHQRTRPRQLDLKQIVRQFRVAWMWELKSSAPCADCDKVFHPVQMSWDHRPGTLKLNDVGLMTHYRRELVMQEIAKCDLVCLNCHALRTHLRRRANAK